MSVLEKFSTRLKTLREERGITQDELGNAIGVSRGSISFYEKQARTPDIEILDRVSRYFDVSLDYLMGYTDSKSREGGNIERIVGLSEDNLKWVTEMSENDKKTFNTFITDIKNKKIISQLSQNGMDIRMSVTHLLNYKNSFKGENIVKLVTGMISRRSMLMRNDAIVLDLQNIVKNITGYNELCKITETMNDDAFSSFENNINELGALGDSERALLEYYLSMLEDEISEHEHLGKIASKRIEWSNDMTEDIEPNPTGGANNG